MARPAGARPRPCGGPGPSSEKAAGRKPARAPSRRRKAAAARHDRCDRTDVGHWRFRYHTISLRAASTASPRATLGRPDDGIATGLTTASGKNKKEESKEGEEGTVAINTSPHTAQRSLTAIAAELGTRRARAGGERLERLAMPKPRRALPQPLSPTRNPGSFHEKHVPYTQRPYELPLVCVCRARSLHFC